MKAAWKVLLAAFAVQGAIASCSAAADHVESRRAQGDPPDGAASLVDAIVQEGAALLDALSGIDSADAAPTPDEVHTVTCSRTVTWDAGAGVASYLVAEQAFPGRSAKDLSAVRALVRYASNVSGAAQAAGYDTIVTSPWVKDGSVMHQCGGVGSNYVVDVTFILPGSP